jgi:hypothetical protein
MIEALKRYEENSNAKSHLIKVLEEDLKNRVEEAGDLKEIIETLS